MKKRNTLFLILVYGLVFIACYNKYEQELIVVSKTPRGAYVGEKVPPGHDLAWYEIGIWGEVFWDKAEPVSDNSTSMEDSGCKGIYH